MELVAHPDFWEGEGEGEGVNMKIFVKNEDNKICVRDVTLTVAENLRRSDFGIVVKPDFNLFKKNTNTMTSFTSEDNCFVAGIEGNWVWLRDIRNVPAE